MDINRAKEIIGFLAEGIDPATGEILPDSDSCNMVDVVRAYYTVLEFINSAPEMPASILIFHICMSLIFSC